MQLNILVEDQTFYDYAEYVHVAINCTWYNVLIALTVDRFLEVWLNIKYELYITTKTTKIVLFISYLVGTCIFLVLVVLKLKLNEINHYKTSVKLCLYPVYGALTIGAFSCTYLYIYYRLRAARNHPGVRSAGVREKRRNHFIPLWIIISFIVFMAIPYSAYVIIFSIMEIDTRKSNALPVIKIFLLLNFTADALIYTCFHRSLRNKFLQLIRWRRICTRNETVAPNVNIPLGIINSNM